MAASVTAATFCLAEMSSESTLADLRISMAVSSSRMLPDEEESTCRILFSSSASWREFSADCTMSRFFSSSRSGRSCAETMPSSWSVSPSGVIMKFTSVTLVDVSGR